MRIHTKGYTSTPGWLTIVARYNLRALIAANQLRCNGTYLLSPARPSIRTLHDEIGPVDAPLMRRLGFSTMVSDKESENRCVTSGDILVISWDADCTDPEHRIRIMDPQFFAEWRECRKLTEGRPGEVHQGSAENHFAGSQAA